MAVLSVNEALKRGAEAHKAGNLQEAARYYAAVLNSQPDNPHANHNLGVLAMGIGKTERAIPFFDVALRVAPHVEQFWISMIDALMRLGQRDRARHTITKARKASVSEAVISKLENRVNVHNEDILPQHKSDSILALFSSGKFGEVIEEAEKLLPKFGNSTGLYLVKGAAHLSLRQYEEAIDCHEQALRLSPDNPDAWSNLGAVHMNRRAYREAITCYERAVGLSSKNLEHYFTAIGRAYRELDEMDAAIDGFKRAINLVPNHIKAYAGVAEAYEKRNMTAELAAWLDDAERAFENLPDELLIYKAALTMRSQNFEEAHNVLSKIDAQALPGRGFKIRTSELLGKCSDRLNNFDEAFEHFSEMNALVKLSPAYLSQDPEAYFQSVRVQKTALQETEYIAPINRDSHTDFSPTFLVGFPRSGTTLLDTILRSHSRIQVVEEKPALSHAKDHLLASDSYNFIDNFPKEEIRREAKDVYRSQLQDYIEEKAEGQEIIDKLPLNILSTMYSNYLFPNSKYIFSIRHPMDVIFSNWSHNFKMNNAMSNFVSLDRIVSFYVLTMEVFKIAREKFDLDVHMIRYEDLVLDLSGETSNLLKFFDLSWEDRMADYSSTALARGRIHTPSYSQVVQPLYRESIGRWKDYSKQLSKYFDQVAPWCTEFGYEPVGKI